MKCPLCNNLSVQHIEYNRTCVCMWCKHTGPERTFRDKQMNKQIGFGELPANPEDRPNLNDISQGKVVANSLAPNTPIGTIVAWTPESKANDIQHGGTHYKKMAIQPWDYIVSNNLGYLEGNAVKYLSRWREKNGVEDLKKAIHYIEKLIEIETNEKQSINTPNNQATT